MQSFVSGIIGGVAAAVIGAGISIVGAAALLAVWHDAQTIRSSLESAEAVAPSRPRMIAATAR